MAVSSEEPRPNGAINNSTMEMTTVNGSSSVHATSDQHVYSTTDRLTVVSKAIPIIRQRIIELEICDQSYINSTTLEGFLEFITKERLTRVPHRGSRWDRVLKCAEYFALQISVYGDSIEGFAPRSKSGCQMALSQCRVLLEFGPSQAQALETAFTVFYKLALSISFFLRNASLFHVDQYISKELGHAFADLLTVVTDVTVHYRDEIYGMASKFTMLDFRDISRSAIDAFYSRKNHIADAMWSYSLQRSRRGIEIDVQTLRRWLRVGDRTAQILSSDCFASRNKPAEYTCEWSQSHLDNFLRSHDDILAITGPEGCGKSVLYGWIEQRLQRPLHRRSYETISYAFEADIPSGASSLAFVKSLLLQLLERSVGDVDFYSQLITCYQISTKGKEAEELELALWHALEAGLEKITRSEVNLVILVDGLNEISGPEGAASKLFESLQQLTNRYATVKAIVLSSLPPWPTAKKLRQLSITEDQTRHDIRRIIQSEIEELHFPEASYRDRNTAVEELVCAAKGSFLWTVLTLESLRSNARQQILATIEREPRTLDEAINKLIAKLDLKNQDCRRILGWILVAERPLRLQELQHLLQVDLQKQRLTGKNIDIQTAVEKACGSTVVISQGIVRFRHGAVRKHLLNTAANRSSLMPPKEAQRDFVMRILAWVKLHLTRHYETTFEPLDLPTLKDTFRSYELLEYTVRYWIPHFRQSSLYTEGSLKLSAEFKAIFPSSSLLSVIEWACWDTQTRAWDARDLHDLAFRVRREVFGQSHKAVLQSMIVTGSIYRQLSLTSEASTYFYQASRVAQAILHKFSAVTITCATTFLVCTEHIRSTKRTDVITRREEILKLIITVYRHQYGETSDIVIRHYKMLASLYVEIQEEHLATIIYRELHQIIIMRFGKASEEAQEVSQKMMIVLKKDSKREDIIEYAKSIFEVSEETMEIVDIRRITITIQLAEAYEFRGDILMAEQIFVNLWRKITEICRLRHSVEIHIAKIDIALAYAEFLKRCDRREEVSSILICLWTEYKCEVHGSEDIVVRLRKIGELMRSVGLLHLAISVFTLVWEWFKVTGKITHDEAAMVTVLISETVEEEITTSTTTSTSISTTTTTVVSESIIREIFETTIKRTVSTKTQVELFKICDALVTIYVVEKKWSEAIQIISRFLEIVWKVIICGEGELSLPSGFVSETILITLRLARCYQHNSFEKAEQIYLRIFQACLASLHVQDERVTQAAYAVIKFYEEQHRHEKAIEIYLQLLERYRSVLGTTDSLTVKTLYTLGSLCVLYGRVEAYSYYLEIVTSLNKDSDVCHHGAIDAAIILSKWYYEQERWLELEQLCKILWKTLVHHHNEYTFTEGTIEVLYERYSHTLRFYAKVEISVLHKIAVEYRQTCMSIWGVSAEVTIKAMIQLAQICEMIEDQFEEAIKIYEEIITVTRTTTTTTITTRTASTSVLTTVKRRLTKLYVTVITSASSRASTTTTIKRAISLCREVYEELKIQFGCAYEETLLNLMELVVLYKKLDDMESRSVIIRLLQTTIIDVITKESSASTLYSAASTVASIYVNCELVSQGFELLRELKRQIVIHGFGSTHNFDIRIDHHHVGRVAYVFFVSFEQTLRGSVDISYAELMADLLTESVLYEQYICAMKTETTVELILLHGARLRSFLVVRKREQEVKHLETQMFEVFFKNWGSCFKTQKQILFVFFNALLEELGKDRRDPRIVNVACAAINYKIEAFLKQSKFQEAYELGMCGFQFTSFHEAYLHIPNIAYGFRLCVLMAGRGVNKCPDEKLRNAMLKLSQDVVGEVFRACKKSKINFVQIKLDELDDLIGLLGDQHNFADLEWLLLQLWNSREAQKSWSSGTIISIGRRLVESQFSHGHHDAAIQLCEDICYNCRRADGLLNAKTLDMYGLLSRLYTSAGRYQQAMGVHEEILQLVAFGDDYDDDHRAQFISDKTLVDVAKTQLRLLQRAYQRLGGWDKSAGVYVQLYEQLVKEFGEKELGVQPIGKWAVKAPDDGLGTFDPPASWELPLKEQRQLPNKQDQKQRPRPDIVKRASQNWGMHTMTFKGCGYATLNGG